MAEPAVAMEVPSYVVGEKLGAGGFGEVFRARHAVIGREVAIKVLYSQDPETVARFVAEGRTVNKISHPGIVEIFDFGQLADGRAYCVMELVHGKTLRELLRERGSLPLDEALPILRDIAEAIDAAHAAGVVHRDLKPDNVFVTDAGVKVIDFGLAKLTNADTPPITQTGAVFGTPLYMSPEQCRGKGVTIASDAYSFGAVAYHLLVGEPPFTGEALELALHHLNDQPPATNIDERVDRVLLALMAKDPVQRPAKLADAIAAMAGDAALPSKPRARGRWRWLALPGLAVAIAGVALAMRGSSAPTAADDCEPAAIRLAGVWDSAVRDNIRTHFASQTRKDIVAVGKSYDVELEAYAERWARDWDQACHSDERSRDPLLSAQRRACLDNALVVLRGTAEPLPTADPNLIAVSYPGWAMRRGRLDDCEANEVLRSQVPAPPPEQRDAIMAAMADLERVQSARRGILDAGMTGSADELEKRYAAIEQRLEALHSPATAEVALYRAMTAWQIGRADVSRRKAAREAREHAIALAETYRNDVILARLRIMQIEALLDYGNAGENGDDVVAGAEAAVARAGKPDWLSVELAVQHARYDAHRGRVVAAIDRLHDAIARYPADRHSAAIDHNSAILYLSFVLTMEDHPDARAQIANLVRLAAERIGPVSRHTQIAWGISANEYDYLGDDKAELDALAHAIALADETEMPEPIRLNYRLMRLDLALRLGRNDAQSAFRELSNAGSIDVAANVALQSDNLHALAYLLEHGAVSTDLRTTIAPELAFRRDPAHAPPPQRAATLAYSQGLRGDWKGALERLEREPKASRPWGTPTAEFAAVLGIARVETGDLSGGIDALEDARQSSREEGSFDYFLADAELALARALVASGGDKARALVHARIGVRGLHRFLRETDARAAEQWIAAQR
jgi:hypothetical protein